MSSPLIIFDLDGTLANTGPDLFGTLNRVTSPYNVAPMTMDMLNYVLGQGAKSMIAKAFKLQKLDLQTELHEELFAKFLEDYEQNICTDTHLYDGVLDAIAALKQEGYIFAVCTNKTEYLAKILLEELGVTSTFKAVTGGDTYAFRKPDARHLQETAKLAGADINNSIMIGDSKADIGAAINAGIPSVAVTFGYSDIPPQDLGASRIINHFKELPSAVRDLRL